MDSNSHISCSNYPNYNTNIFAPLYDKFIFINLYSFKHILENIISQKVLEQNKFYFNYFHIHSYLSYYLFFNI